MKKMMYSPLSGYCAIAGRRYEAIGIVTGQSILIDKSIVTSETVPRVALLLTRKLDPVARAWREVLETTMYAEVDAGRPNRWLWTLLTAGLCLPYKNIATQEGLQFSLKVR